MGARRGRTVVRWQVGRICGELSSDFVVGVRTVARSDDHGGGVDFANRQCVGDVENMSVGESFAFQNERFAMQFPIGVLEGVDVDGCGDASGSALEAAVGAFDRHHPGANDVAPGASAENGVDGKS